MLLIVAGVAVLVMAAEGSDEPPVIPERIAGLEVLDVQNKENTSCYPKDTPLFVLQSTHSTHEGLMADSDLMEAIDRDLEEKGFPEGTEVMFSGPSGSKDEASGFRRQWNTQRDTNGCIQFVDPRSAGDSETEVSGKASQIGTQYSERPGYATVVDLEISTNTDTDYNAQSVVLTAPTVGDNQDYFSAFLNNGYTDASPRGYLLQDGFVFEDGDGTVVWTDESWGLRPMLFLINYHVGHKYFFTISYTNGFWWLCVEDRDAETYTYRCRKSVHTEGDSLWGTDNTSVWVENQNENADWYEGFSRRLYAREAKNYVNGAGSGWSSESQELTHCWNETPDPDDHTGTIFGTLVDYGVASWRLDRVPLEC